MYSQTLIRKIFEIILNHCYFVPEFCLPSLNVLAVSDLHLYDLVDFINFLVRQELFHHQSLLSVTVLVAV